MTQSTLLNIGNTTTQIARWNGQSMGPIEAFQTPELFDDGRFDAIVAGIKGTFVVVACVVPEIERKFIKVIPECQLLLITAGTGSNVDFSQIDQNTLGADRVANAVAAVSGLSLPAIILDCGTAITTDVIDRDRRFLGGSITPGRRLCRAALRDYTGQLPMIDLKSERPPAVGATTESAIRAGIDLGLIGAVEKIISETREQLGAERATVIAIGGDREFFANHLDDVALGPPDFTLRGLSRFADRN